MRAQASQGQGPSRAISAALKIENSELLVLPDQSRPSLAAFFRAIRSSSFSRFPFFLGSADLLFGIVTVLHNSTQLLSG